MGSAVLAGVGVSLPPRIVANDEIAARLDTSDEWITRRTGIKTRHIADPDTATSDLAVEAGARALKSAGTGEADLVLLATTTPDHPCPATAPAVASRLGLGGVPAFDLNAVCSGFVYGMATATAFIASGAYDSVLLIGADTFSTIVDPQDRSGVAVFGDGAGAVVLRAGRADEPGAVTASVLGSDGDLRDLIIVPGLGSRQRTATQPVTTQEAYFTMQGRVVYRHAVHRMAQVTLAVLDRAGWSVDSLDWLIGHQANRRILDAVVQSIGLGPARAVVNVDRVGNTAAASIPIALADALGTGSVAPGQRMVLTAFGGGVTWGAVALLAPDRGVSPTT